MGMAIAGMAWLDIAGSAYRAYAASTGNKNFRGEPMPAFDDLPLPIKTAWEAAVRQAGNCIDRGQSAMSGEQDWNGWVSPSADRPVAVLPDLNAIRDQVVLKESERAV